MSKFRFAIVTGAVALLLMGCSATSSPEESLQDVMEETVTKEKPYAEAQKPLQELEKKEQNLYETIMGLGMKEMDKIQELSDEALKNVDKRKEYIQKEQTSMDEAKETFADASKYIEKLDNADLKRQAQSLEKTMKARYELHSKLTKSYLNVLDGDKELYEMLKKEDLTMEQLEKQVTSINKEYEKVSKFNDEYNDKTNEYNEAKKDLYSNEAFEEKKD